MWLIMDMNVIYIVFRVMDHGYVIYILFCVTKMEKTKKEKFSHLCLVPHSANLPWHSAKLGKNSLGSAALLSAGHTALGKDGFFAEC